MRMRVEKRRCGGRAAVPMARAAAQMKQWRLAIFVLAVRASGPVAEAEQRCQ
jgi:acetaldehyde dehydrogenase (acetylating)